MMRFLLLCRHSNRAGLIRVVVVVIPPFTRIVKSEIKKLALLEGAARIKRASETIRALFFGIQRMCRVNAGCRPDFFARSIEKAHPCSFRDSNIAGREPFVRVFDEDVVRVGNKLSISDDTVPGCLWSGGSIRRVCTSRELIRKDRE